jgi:long-chain acyl-CoA synthetase
VRAITRLEAANPISPSDESLLAHLRSRIGLDRVERAGTCAAPCPRHVQRFFHAIGLPFGEFWGMTEIGIATQTRPGIADLDTVGVPLHGYEISLADDDEVLVRCAHVARGYRNRPEDTAATFGVDGWVRTGDVGVLDEQGRLRIVDRKKELIISSDGHNMAPATIEAELKGETPLIAHACVIGDARPYNVALLVVEPAERASDANAIAAIERAIDAVNARLDPRERVVRHAILIQPWLPGGDELTETNKLRRRAIAQKHAVLIDSLYQASSSSGPELASSSCWTGGARPRYAWPAGSATSTHGTGPLHVVASDLTPSDLT